MADIEEEDDEDEAVLYPPPAKVTKVAKEVTNTRRTRKAARAGEQVAVKKRQPKFSCSTCNFKACTAAGLYSHMRSQGHAMKKDKGAGRKTVGTNKKSVDDPDAKAKKEIKRNNTVVKKKGFKEGAATKESVNKDINSNTVKNVRKGKTAEVINQGNKTSKTKEVIVGSSETTTKKRSRISAMNASARISAQLLEDGP